MGKFFVLSGNGLTVKGLVYSTDSRVRIPDNSFGGLRSRVAYEVDSQVQWSNAESGRMPEGDARQIELYQGNVEILLNKKDGTVVDMTNSGGSLAPENGKTVCVKGNAFEEIIPLEELESVSVGGITFPIPE